MNRPKLFLATTLIVISLNSCFNKNTTTNIEGWWITDEKNSPHFADGTQKIALQIRRDTNKKLTARAFFLWNGKHQSEWPLIDVQYDTIAQSVTIVTIMDAIKYTLKCIADAKNDMLIGEVYLPNSIKNPLNFVRADKNLEIRLLYPRIPDLNGKISYSYKTPEQLDDGLKTESIYRHSTDSSSISNLMKEVIDQKYGSIKSLLILKNNKLIVEEYFYGYNRNDLHQIFSCTKSITSLLLGIALDRHKDVKTDQAIFTFFPQYNSLKTEGREKINLKHVLTMTAGLQGDDDKSGELQEADDCFQYILSSPLESKPGEKFKYNSGCSILLGGVISFLETKKTQIFAENFLFRPLGITEYFWGTNKDGTLQCDGGLRVRPRDMAKIGLLALNDGIWQNKQVVSKEWIRESTKPHVQESKFFDYGYQWWHHSKNNLQWWKEPNAVSPKEHDLITALGGGGQYIMIIRDLNLVIVTTASQFESGKMARSKIPMVIEKIVPIFEDT
jgi:CubicO group peptidase (beta-lactamase class C family)